MTLISDLKLRTREAKVLEALYLSEGGSSHAAFDSLPITSVLETIGDYRRKLKYIKNCGKITIESLTETLGRYMDSLNNPPPEGKRLVTIRKAHEITGASQSFFKQLLREKKLTRYKIHSATYVSLVEFEQLASISQEVIMKKVS